MIYKRTTEGYVTEMLYRAAEDLPPRLKNAVCAVDRQTASGVCEIRLRSGLPFSLSTYSAAVFIGADGKPCREERGLRCTAAELEYTVASLCQGSVYRCADTLRRGYIVTSGGVRAGVCGRANYSGGVLSSVCEYTAVNLRIPRRRPHCADSLVRFMSDSGLASAIVYSPPGVGKTTFVRELALELSRRARTAVIDERYEIMPEAFAAECGMCDIFRGYTKPDGMEAAIRLFSPQVVICDEIGMADDVPAVLSVQNCGVPLIATAHAASVDELLSKPNIAALLKAGVFSYAVRLERRGSGMEVCAPTELS